MGKLSESTSCINAAGLLLLSEHTKSQLTGEATLIPVLRVGTPFTKVVKKKCYDYEQNGTD